MEFVKDKVVDFDGVNGAGVSYTLPDGFVIGVESDLLTKGEKIAILKKHVEEY